MAISSGRLRHTISVQTRATTQSTSGQPTGTWSELLAARALVEEVSGAEKWAEAVNLGEITHTITMRYRSGIDRSKRVVWGTRVMNIESVLTDPRKRRMTLRCKEVV